MDESVLAFVLIYPKELSLGSLGPGWGYNQMRVVADKNVLA